MNWLTSYVRKPLSNLVKRDSPDELWDKCKSCQQMIYLKSLGDSQYTCPNCNDHRFWPILDRLTYLYDGGHFRQIDLPDVIADPLKFRDKKTYSARMRENLAKSDQKEALVIAQGTVGGAACCHRSIQFHFYGWIYGYGSR